MPVSPRPPLPQLVVRPHDPARSRLVFVAIALLWAFSLVVVWRLGSESSAPGFGDLRVQQAKRTEELGRATTELETLRQRESEISSLRADIAFFERLVGGGAPRQPLAINAFAVRPIGDSGGYAWQLTLTQNLKKAAVTSGGVDISIDGVLDGKLKTLALADLLQARNATSVPFSFKYFQRLEGNFMLPDKFTPNRVRLVVKSSAGEQAQRSIAWVEALASGEKNDVR
jgi:hypothetical protein